MDDLEAAVEQVVRGDSAAFRRIVDQTHRQLIRLSARILGSIEAAEDVVQEAYVRAYRSLTEGTFEQRASVRTWLYRIVVNGSIDARRSSARRLRQAGQVGQVGQDLVEKPIATLSPTMEARLALVELSRWLETLPEEQRLALLLTTVEGLAAREVAEILGCSEGAVEQRLLRARVTLRQKRDAP